MEYHFININTEAAICRITLNRPEKQNALHAGLISELATVFNQLAKETEIHFVVLDGTGKSFCSGADLEWFSESGKQSEKENRMQFELLSKMLRRLYRLPQITIALAKGNIFGGGIGLASACDLVLMEESTTLAFSEVHLGLVPATILPFVANRINRREAKLLMLTGKQFSADKAFGIGLADILCATGHLENCLLDIIHDLQKPVAGAVIACKQLINKVYSGEIGSSDGKYLAQILAQRIDSDETRARINSFLTKKAK